MRPMMLMLMLMPRALMLLFGTAVNTRMQNIQTQTKSVREYLEWLELEVLLLL